MVEIGTRNERIRKTLENIGPAVLNGGFSTFLAFILLSFSKSHVFLTFFKIFFLVVVFGLFHGLVFLPVILSLIGPKPYDLSGSDKDEKMIEMKEEKEKLKNDHDNENESPPNANQNLSNNSHDISNSKEKLTNGIIVENKSHDAV